MRTTTAMMILLILGVAVRLAATWVRPTDLTLDNDGYLAHAEMVRSGNGFAGPSTHRPTAFRPPVYPIALGGLISLGLSPAVSVMMINGLSSVAVICGVWILSSQLRLPPRFACLATGIAVFDPLLVRYSILPMTEVPAAAMLVLAVVMLKAAENRLDVTDKRLFQFRSIAGVLFGVGSLVRPILLVSCAILVLWRMTLVLKFSSGIRKNFLFAILPMIAAVFAITPWIVRNAIHFGKIIPATTHGGYTLALGNNPDFYRDVIDGQTGFPWPGPQLDAWQHRMIANATLQGVPAGNEPAQDAWYYSQAFDAIRAHPVSFLKSCLLRLRRFWAITPGTDEGLPWYVIVAIGFWYGILGIGLVATLWKIPFGRLSSRETSFRIETPQPQSLVDLWLVILSFMLLHTFYWTDARMRTPVMPLIGIIAAVGWRSVINSIFVLATGRVISDTSFDSKAFPESPT